MRIVNVKILVHDTDKDKEKEAAEELKAIVRGALLPNDKYNFGMDISEVDSYEKHKVNNPK